MTDRSGWPVSDDLLLGNGVGRGQRGFLHKSKIGRFFGGVVKRGLQVAGATGIPVVSQAAKFGGSFLSGGSRDPNFLVARRMAVSRGRQSTFAPRPVGPGGVLSLFPGVPGGVTGFAQETPGGECPKGFHSNRSSYYVRSSNEWVPEGTRCVKNRRRNLDNGRAATRAARRLVARDKHNDLIDRALRGIAGPVRRRTKKSPSGQGRTTVIQN